MLPVRVHAFSLCQILNQEFIILFDVVGDCQDSKARYSFSEQFFILNICHQRIFIIVITQAFTLVKLLITNNTYPFGVNYFYGPL